MNRPPTVSLEPSPDGFVLTASTQSPAAWFFLIFATVWTLGSVGIFTLIQILRGHFSLWITLFTLPFLLVSAYLFHRTAMLAAGYIRITRTAQTLTIFTGFGTWGTTRTFPLADILSVTPISKVSSDEDTAPSHYILIQFHANTGRKPHQFADLLTPDARDFVIQKLRTTLG